LRVRNLQAMLECYAEMPHILCKDTSNRTKNKILSNVLIYV